MLSQTKNMISSHSFGFIGLGVMGYPMALNVARKLSNTQSPLYVYDISTEVLQRFQKEMPGAVCACSNAREVTKNSVSMCKNNVILEE